MECREVEKRLSAYIEKVVSPKGRALMERHLKGCKGCRRALVDLKKTIQYVQKLEEVEPPARFAQKVMTRVRAETEVRRGLVQRLFFPLPIKLPLEAIALIVVAVGVAYVFKVMQPDMRFARIPTETREMIPAPATTPQKEKPPAVEKERPAPATGGEQVVYEKKREAHEEQSVKMAQAPTALAQKKEAASTTGYADRATLKRDVASSLQGSQPQATMEIQAQETYFVVHVRDLKAARRRVEGIVQQLGGKAITAEPLRKDKAVIAIELDANKVADFRNQLQLVGEVQDKGVVLEEGEGTVEVRVEVEQSPR